MTPLSAEQLLEHSTLRRQLRDCPGLTEKRPGVFASGNATLVELGLEGNAAIAKLLPLGHGSAQTYALDDAVKRRSLVDAVRLRLKRLAED